MHAARSSDQQPTRTVGVGELKARAEEIVREVQETGRSIDVVQDGKLAARLSPAPTAEPEIPDASSIEERERAVRDRLRKMDELSREIATAWPRGVSAQDVIDDVRGSW
jgi:antitoxin (DNA-binding transcriptional repressor) of toxin-antitoxin stability system